MPADLPLEVSKKRGTTPVVVREPVEVFSAIIQEKQARQPIIKSANHPNSSPCRDYSRAKQIRHAMSARKGVQIAPETVETKTEKIWESGQPDMGPRRPRPKSAGPLRRPVMVDTAHVKVALKKQVSLSFVSLA